MIMRNNDIRVSIVIPIYNEEFLLQSSIAELSRKLNKLNFRYEIILAENGSTDRTISIAMNLSHENNSIIVLSFKAPNYGKALREGIAKARGTYVICEEIDLCDIDFHARSLRILERGNADMVIGSKAMIGSIDERPFIRRYATRVINSILKVAVGFRGTDTHGLKAFNRQSLLPILSKCILDKDLFASEFVIRATLSNLCVVEIPVSLTEKRPPSINLLNRIPRVLIDVVRLIYIFRIQNQLTIRGDRKVKSELNKSI